ncbi:uncharacterized protein LOC144703775 [Wolffia australiana]
MADATLHTSIFYTYVKINDKVCKLIVDSGRCIDAISDVIVAQLGLAAVPFSTPYDVSLIDTSSLSLKRQCHVLLKVSSYDESILCEVLSMKVGRIILSCPWLYDNDVTLARRTNTCSFVYQGWNVTWYPYTIKLANKTVPTRLAGLVIVRGTLFPQDLGREIDDTPVCLIIALDASPYTPVAPRPPEVESLISEFSGVFLEELLDDLPLMRHIHHVIDLVARASLPNLPHYCMEP